MKKENLTHVAAMSFMVFSAICLLRISRMALDNPQSEVLFLESYKRLTSISQ